MAREDTQFKPGESGNPAGRPKGARNKLSDAFFKALADDFVANGVDVIRQLRTENPAVYSKVIAGLMPRIQEHTGEDGGAINLEELRIRIVDPRHRPSEEGG